LSFNLLEIKEQVVFTLPVTELLLLDNVQ